MVVNRNNLQEHLLTHQLSMIGKTIEDAKQLDDWFHKWTFTEEQYNQFKDYAVPLIQKTLKCSKPSAIKTFQWFDLGFGLRLQNHEDIQTNQPSE